jgi:uncharacterized protein (TIGR03437 family)
MLPTGWPDLRRHVQHLRINLSTQGTAFWTIVNNALPTATAGSTVLVNGKPAYLNYVSPTLINAMPPPTMLWDQSTFRW